MRPVPVEDIRKEVFVHGTGAALGPQVKQRFQALDAFIRVKGGLVTRQTADEAQTFDPRQDTILGSLLPDLRSGNFDFRRQMVFDQIGRNSGKWLFRQKILHRLPEEDWRMKINRFVAD